jgi:hypothetical protein
MIGNNIIYEPSFENRSIINKGKGVGVDEKCRIPVRAALGYTGLTCLK